MTRKHSRLTRILAMLTSLSILLATLSVMAFAEETAEDLSPAPACVSAPAAPQESAGERNADTAPVAAQASAGEVSADPAPAMAQPASEEGSAETAPAADSTYTFSVTDDKLTLTAESSDAVYILTKKTEP